MHEPELRADGCTSSNVAGSRGKVKGRARLFSKNPYSPMKVAFTDFRAQCRYYLYTWIPWAVGFGVP